MRTAMTQQQTIPPPCMPDGRPAPWLMTMYELIDFLRIKTRHPRDTVAQMRKRGLKAVQVSRNVYFQVSDVLEFLRAEQERNPR